jgi:hypothetical protein
MSSEYEQKLIDTGDPYGGLCRNCQHTKFAHMPSGYCSFNQKVGKTTAITCNCTRFT